MINILPESSFFTRFYTVSYLKELYFKIVKKYSRMGTIHLRHFLAAKRFIRNRNGYLCLSVGTTM